MYIHTLKTDGVQVILLAPNQVSPTPMSTSFQVDIKPENPLSAEVELGVTSLAPPQSYWPRLCQQSNTKGTLRCSPLGLSLSALLHTPPHTQITYTQAYTSLLSSLGGKQWRSPMCGRYSLPPLKGSK